MSALLTAAAAALTACPAADTASAAVEGRIRDVTAGAAVAHAVVEVRSRGATRRRTRADDTGRYRLEGLSPGWLTIVARHQGYRSSRVRVRVGPGQCLAVNFRLELDPVRLPTLRVSGLPAERRVEAPEAGHEVDLASVLGPGAPAMEALRSTPLGGAGLGAAVRRSVRPRPADPSVLYVRGTTAPLEQVLLDGAPVQTPFHLSGLLASRPPGVIGRSRLRGGGARPRFGGGLLYTLDLETRAPSDGSTRHGGSVDRLGAAARASGPAGPVDYLASLRTLHPGRRVGGDRSLEARDYADGLLRLSAGGPEEGLRAAATGFWNRASTPLAGEGGGRESATWGNAAGSIRLGTGRAGTGWRATLAGSRYWTELPTPGSGPAPAVSAEVDEQRGVLRYVERDGRLEWSAGAAARRTGQRLLIRGDLLASSDGERGEAHRLGAFASARWHASERLSLRAGFRADHFSTDGSVRPAPRAAASLRLSPETTLRLSAGRVHQLMAGWETRRTSPDGSADAEVEARTTPGPPSPQVAGASRLRLELEHEDRDGLRLGAAGHFRHLEGIAATALFDTIPARGQTRRGFEPMEVEPTPGGAYSSGLDVWGGWSGENVRVWANWALTWLWGAPDAEGVSSRFAARQVLSGGAEAELPGGFRARGSLSGSWGLPMTPLPVTRPDAAGVPSASTHGPERGDGRAPYVRMDLRLERSFTASLFGTELRLAPYAELINALDRENALFHRLPAAGGGLQAVNPVPMLPVIGIEWSG